jgi:hypothetical protein
MFSETHYRAVKDHYRDLIEEAEHERLVWQAREGESRHEPLYHRAIAWFGYRLANTGTYLVNRYGKPALATPPNKSIHWSNGRSVLFRVR